MNDEEAYIRLVLNDQKVQEMFVSRGIIDLVEMYSIMRRVADENGVSYDEMSVEEVIELVSANI